MPEASRVVDSPAVPLHQRLAVTSALARSPRIAPPALRLVSLLVERGRVAMLGRVSDEFTRQPTAHRGIVWRP